MNLSFFLPVVLHILPPLFHAILSRILAKLLGLEDGNGRENGHAGNIMQLTCIHINVFIN